MPTSSGEYRLSPRALDDLESIWLHSLAEWGESQSYRYLDDLTAAFELLAENPEAGTTCDYLRTGYRKYPVLRHVLYYRTLVDRIEIVRVLHDRMLAVRYL